MGNKEYIEICGELWTETNKAYLISDDGEREIWIPKSQVDEGSIDFNSETKIINFEIPEWLAIEKELV